jgi:DNA-binding transcriptional ArsR family regulator
MMQDVMYLERIEQAETLLKPRRIDILRRLAEPHSCPEIATALEESTQKIYYHVKRLEEAELVDRVAERRVRGIVEGVYQARARSYWLSPNLVGRIGRKRSESELSLGFLLTLAEDVTEDVARLACAGVEVPTVGFSAEIYLPAEQREAFLHDLQAVMQELLTQYGGAEGPAFKIAFACYPKGDQS